MFIVVDDEHDRPLVVRIEIRQSNRSRLQLVPRAMAGQENMTANLGKLRRVPGSVKPPRTLSSNTHQTVMRALLLLSLRLGTARPTPRDWSARTVPHDGSATGTRFGPKSPAPDPAWARGLFRVERDDVPTGRARIYRRISP
jgi:hypothetical protein